MNTPPELARDSAAYGPVGLRIGVLLQVRADVPRSDDETSTFFLRKAELALKGQVSSHTHFSLELDPVRPGDPFRRTYLRLSHIPRLHLKLGMEKAPVGLDELLATATLPFVDRSEVNDRFAMAEEVGVHLESRWDHSIFQLSVTNGGRRLLRDDNDQKDVSARLVWGPVPWASVGLSALQGWTGAEALQRDRFNAEVKLGSVASGFQGEFYRARDDNVFSSAFYAASFHLIEVDLIGLTHLQPAVRYEWVDRSDGERAEEMRLLTLGVGFLLDGHSSKLQLNYLADLRQGMDEGGVRVQYQVEF